MNCLYASSFVVDAWLAVVAELADETLGAACVAEADARAVWWPPSRRTRNEVGINRVALPTVFNCGAAEIVAPPPPLAGAGAFSSDSCAGAEMVAPSSLAGALTTGGRGPVGGPGGSGGMPGGAPGGRGGGRRGGGIPGGGGGKSMWRRRWWHARAHTRRSHRRSTRTHQPRRRQARRRPRRETHHTRGQTRRGTRRETRWRSWRTTRRWTRGRAGEHGWELRRSRRSLVLMVGYVNITVVLLFLFALVVRLVLRPRSRVLVTATLLVVGNLLSGQSEEHRLHCSRLRTAIIVAGVWSLPLPLLALRWPLFFFFRGRRRSCLFFRVVRLDIVLVSVC